jgi:5-methyltetrahydropteroyltriglutamate--homocysteine methyltransferase
MQTSKGVEKMKINCSISGVLPRPPCLINETRKYDRSRITAEELELAYKEYTKEVIAVQVQQDLTYINDGYLRRQDLLRPFTTKLSGVEEGQLYRWYNNNTFYRIPLIKGNIDGEAPFNETYLDLLTEGEYKAVLPAPYTFVKLAKNEYYASEVDFLFDVAEVINAEIKALEQQGYKYIQLSDPSLVYHKTVPEPDELSVIGEAVAVAIKGVKAWTGLQTFFGDIIPVLGSVIEWSVDDIGMDYYETDSDTVKEYSFKGGVSLGIVDSRNTLQENLEELVAICMELIEASNPVSLMVTTNCDLDFLTWDEAQHKIATVAKIAKQLKEELL